MGHSRPFTFDRVVRLSITTLAVGAGLYLLYLLRTVLLPFLIAWLFAYMLNPIVKFFERKLKIGHGLSVVLTLLCCAGVVALLVYLLVPIVEVEIGQIDLMLSNYKTGTPDNDRVTFHVSELIHKYVDFNEIKGLLSQDKLIDTIQSLSPALEQLLSNTVSFIVGFTVVFIIILYLIFIMLDYDKINELWRRLIPPKYRSTVNRITNDVEHSMNTYFRYQALICLILAVLYSIGFQIIGLPMAIVFGIFVGMIHMIPYMQVISFPPAILLCWLRASQTGDGFWMMLGFTALVYVAVQCILDLYLIPRIMGKAMGLNPAIILLSLSIWGFLLGIVGMIIAIPLTTLLLSYYRAFISSAERVHAVAEARKKVPPSQDE